MMKSILIKAIFPALALTLAATNVWSQPGPIPPGTNAACAQNGGTDTVTSTPDSEGFRTLFDGTSFKGWWESCQSHHSALDAVNGGIWLVDPGLHAIYSNQSPKFAGSLLLTNKKFDQYELQFDYWPEFADDAGIFNRTTPDGKSY